jgi:hypothetical protein
MMPTSKHSIRFRIEAKVVEEHSICPGDYPDHRLSISSLSIETMEPLEGVLPGTFENGTTSSIGDRSGNAGSITAYPVYSFREGRILARQVLEFRIGSDGGREAQGEWRWIGGSREFERIRGEGSLKTIATADQSRRVVEYGGTYWFE